jgi:hypothetical protein
MVSWRAGRYSRQPQERLPSDSWRDGKIEKVRQLLLQNCHLSLWMIADEFEISKDTEQKIVIENLKKKEFSCALYHLHWLQNRWRTELLLVQILLRWLTVILTSSKEIVTGDKSWCFAYDPATKQQSSVWVRENLPPLQKFWFQKSQVKNMLVIYDWQGVMHKEFVPEGQIVNCEFYKAMDRNLKRLWRVRPVKA